MNLELYTEVVLTHDFPEENLYTGDIATLVDYIIHPDGGEDGVVLEIFNAVGESIGVTAVPLSAVAPLQPTQMPTVRSLALHPA